LLQRPEPDTSPLWREAEQHVARQNGLLIVDDTTLDKPYAQQIALVHHHWSGKQHRVVAGINLVTLLWSDGEDAIPCDYRLFDKPVDNLTKKDHFRAMLDTAKTRRFEPRSVAFDSWYSSLVNLKAIRDHGWQWLTRLKANRLVNPDGSSNRALAECSLREAGTRVHLKGYGFILVFRLDTPDSDTQYWATSDLFLDRGSPHRAQRSRELARALRMELRWLPTACPELNPVDHLWRHLKRDVLGNCGLQKVTTALDRALVYLQNLSPEERRRKAGLLAPGCWLRKVL
jgi:hypothetical protein